MKTCLNEVLRFKPSTMKSVIIVEDAKGVRQQLVRLIESVSDMKCLGAFASGEEALPVILKTMPDVVLMDIGLPRMSGIQCVAEIKRIFPDIKVIMVTAYVDSERIFRALKSGANGYLVKTNAPEQLINAIRDVHQGGAPMSGSIARKVVQHFHRLGPSAQESGNLSPREEEVLGLLTLGFAYKEIGNQLDISSETVRTYVKQICKKMQVRRPVEAVVKHQALAGK